MNKRPLAAAVCLWWASAAGAQTTLELGEPLGVMAVSADGAFVAAGGKSGKIKVLAVAGGEGFTLDDGQAYLQGLAFAGGSLVSTGDNRLLIWDLARRKRIEKMKGPYGLVAASLDGKRLAVVRGVRGRPNEIVQIAVPGGKILQSGADKLNGPVTAIGMAPDGAYFQWAGYRYVPDAASGYDLKARDDENTYGFTVPWPQDIAALAVSPDGKETATAYGKGFQSSIEDKVAANEIRWVDYKSYKVTKTAQAAGTPVSLAYSSDGSRLASLLRDGTVELWSATDASRLASFQAGGRSEAVAFASGRLVVGREDGKILVWDAAALLAGGPKARAPSASEQARRSLLEQGRQLSKAGRHMDAVRAFTQLIRSDPKDAAAYVNRGAVLERMGKMDLALKDYARAIAADPEAPAAYLNRALARMAAKDWRAAVADLDSYLALAPKDSDAYQYRGLCRHELGDFRDASLDYNAAVKTGDGRNADAFFGLGLSSLEACAQGCGSSAWGSIVESFGAAQTLAPNDNFAQWLERAKAERAKARGAEAAENRAYYESHKSANVFSMIGDAFGGMALSVSAGASGGSGGGSSGYSSGSSSGGGTASSGGGSRGYDAQAEADRTTRQYNEQVRRNVENKLWNMNNPYK